MRVQNSQSLQRIGKSQTVSLKVLEKIVKILLRKSLDSGEDFMKNLLIYRTTLLQGPVAGTGRRLGRDVDPTSRLGSLQTSEWYFRVARRRRSEGRRRNEPRPA